MNYNYSIAQGNLIPHLELQVKKLILSFGNLFSEIDKANASKRTRALFQFLPRKDKLK